MYTCCHGVVHVSDDGLRVILKSCCLLQRPLLLLDDSPSSFFLPSPPLQVKLSVKGIVIGNTSFVVSQKRVRISDVRAEAITALRSFVTAEQGEFERPDELFLTLST